MKRVLFVCEGNTFRSVIAEALFNAARPTGWVGVSAGIHPGVERSPAAIELLREIGLDCPNSPPRAVTGASAKRASRVVTFGCELAVPIRQGVEQEGWPVQGGWGKTERERREIREEIRRRVHWLKSDILSNSQEESDSPRP